MVKNPSANAGNARDADSIPGSGRSPGVGWHPAPVFLPDKEPGELQPMGSQRHGHPEHTHACNIIVPLV